MKATPVLRPLTIGSSQHHDMIRSTASLVAFLSLVLFVSQAVGLIDNGTTRYATFLNSSCSLPNQECCKYRSPKCSIGYNMIGDWNTERDSATGKYNCKTECLAHRKKCVSACKCAVRSDEVRNGDICKCTRSPSISTKSLSKSCSRSCKKAFISCLKVCVVTKCPLVARTTMFWRATYPGKCSGYCRNAVKPPFPAEISKKCPFIVGPP